MPTVKELRARYKKLEISGFSRLNKAELEKSLKIYDNKQQIYRERRRKIKTRHSKTFHKNYQKEFPNMKIVSNRLEFFGAPKQLEKDVKKAITTQFGSEIKKLHNGDIYVLIKGSKNLTRKQLKDGVRDYNEVGETAIFDKKGLWVNQTKPRTYLSLKKIDKITKRKINRYNREHPEELKFKRTNKIFKK